MKTNDSYGILMTNKHINNSNSMLYYVHVTLGYS